MIHVLETWGSLSRTKQRKISGFIKRGPHRGKQTFLDRFSSINIHSFILPRSTTWTDSRLSLSHQVSRGSVRRKKRKLDGETCAIEDDLSIIWCFCWVQYISSVPYSTIKCILYLRVSIWHNYKKGERVRYGYYVAFFIMMLIVADIDDSLRFSLPRRHCVIEF